MSKSKYSAETEINRLINAPGASLAGLIDRAHKILWLQSQLSEVLPEDCRAHCHFVSYRSGLLKLQADSATWATRLRFQQPQIIQRLRQVKVFTDIEKIKVLVRPQYIKASPKISAKAISPEAAEHLRAMADSLDQPGLSAALRHLIEPR